MDTPVTDLSDDNVTVGGNDPTVTLLGVVAPSITLEKTGTFIDENNDGYADIGETVSYEFNVTNTGNIILYDVNITDDNAVVTGGPMSV